MSQTALELRGISVARGGRLVVRDVDLTVPAGAITALLGPNGAGKSSLVLGVAGVIPLAAGQVAIDGRPLKTRSAHGVRAAGIAIVPEGHRVLRAMTVRDHLRAAGSRLPARELGAAVDEALARFPELAERTGQRAGTLSGGQQQMLAIASALVGRPGYVILDELSLGLAPAVVRRLGPVVGDVAASGIGVLLIEQFANVALELADRAYVLDRGSIAFSGQGSELVDRPDLLHGVYLAAS
jgi:branched-chain amino acid transport system ATP-binding protein